ncbi:MAG: ATP-binding protein [Patescibacteria group bacterium]|nr:ATP-binding protein [Patescibacteria group bacterium]
MMNNTQITTDELKQVIIDSSRISVDRYIDRDDYFAWCKSGLDNDFIKVITGFRRTGKSFLLKQLKQYLIKNKNVPEENIFFINFEHDILAKNNQVEDLRKMLELFEAHIAKDGKVYLFLDEIQNVKYWEKFIRTIYDSQKDKYNIYLTGSNSSLLSGEFSTALAGRTIEMQIRSFDFKEYLKLSGVKIDSSFDKVKHKTLLERHLYRYLHWGGLPETIGRKDEEIRQYIKSLFRKVLLDDIVKRFGVEKVAVIEKLLYYIFSNIGGTTSFSNIANTLNNEGEKISVPTLQSYAEMYEQSFALNKIEKFEWKTKKIFSKQYKFYAVDNGLVSNINISKFGIEEKLLENIVYNVLAKKYPKIYYGRNNEDREIDFIAPRSENHFLKIRVSIEINAQNKKREFGNFVVTDKYLKNGKNILITLNGKNQTHNYKGSVIQEVPLLNFLLSGDYEG